MTPSCTRSRPDEIMKISFPRRTRLNVRVYLFGFICARVISYFRSETKSSRRCIFFPPFFFSFWISRYLFFPPARAVIAPKPSNNRETLLDLVARSVSAIYTRLFLERLLRLKTGRLCRLIRSSYSRELIIIEQICIYVYTRTILRMHIRREHSWDERRKKKGVNRTGKGRDKEREESRTNYENGTRTE